MQAHLNIGRPFGIQVGLHYSWLIIALLIAFSLAAHFQQMNPEWGPIVVWASALITASLFFTALVGHELAHALIARGRGIPVRSITLFALGGVTQLEKDTADAKTEFWMGIAGPIASAAFGLLFLGTAWTLGWTATETPKSPALAVLVWLGYINFGLAAFNLIPAFPLDGGRVFRAILWWKFGNADRSTRIAAQVGQVFATFFIMYGLLRFFGGAGFGGLWIAFIGWFLLDAAAANYREVQTASSLRDVRVSDVMSLDCPVVHARDNIETFVHDKLLRTGQRCFLVQEGGQTTGLITTHEVKEIGRTRWPYTIVRDVMRPLDQVHSIEPSSPVTKALEKMTGQDVNQLAVISDGQFKGIISRSHVLQFLQTRAELNI